MKQLAKNIVKQAAKKIRGARRNLKRVKRKKIRGARRNLKRVKRTTMSTSMRGFVSLLSGRDRPKYSAASPRGNLQTLEFISTTSCQMVAEIGIYKGATSKGFAKHLNGQGELHLFDFEDRVREVKAELNNAGYDNVVAHGNSRKTYDSYNWSLMRVLQAHNEPIYDYVLLDGAHTWNTDALAFFLLDRLLCAGGYIDFDDYNWSFAKSPTWNPKDFPAIRRMHTMEQIRARQVRLVVDLLVKSDSRYIEVVENKIYRKMA